MNIQLQDGRRLEYAEYGDPGGKPVFFFHGIPGSRIFRPPCDELTAGMGVRLITIDRPGYGGSTFQPGRRVLEWPKDLLELADHLGVKKFAVAGHSGGAPYVAASAFALPDRVLAASILSGLGPADAPDATKGMQSTNKMGLLVGRWLPWPFWNALFGLWFQDIGEHPEILFPDEPKGTCAADLEMLDRPGVREVCRESVREAFRQGTTAHAWEGRLQSRPWGFALEEIRVPFHVWHGELDVDAPISMGRTMAGKIPGCHAAICPGEGHLLLINHWKEILKQLVSHF